MSLSLRGGGGSGTVASAASPPVKKSPRIQDVLRSESGTVITDKKKGKGVSIAQGSPEIINPQTGINQYKERLARDLARREFAVRSPQSPADKNRASPIQEESSMSPPPPGSASSSDIPTASTGSNKTVRGGTTPAFTSGLSARTPSYPFPRMTTPGYDPIALQRAFSNQAGDHFDAAVLHDQLRSDPSTPASTMTFQPHGAETMMMERDFPTPNLYELVLMLGAEPGLDAWWTSVVQIMREHYKAERVTLSVPADATDLENVPWGQKATYNSMEEDGYSVGYMGRSSMLPSSGDDLSELASNLDGPQRNDRLQRPSMQSRHSFTSYENKKESRVAQFADSPSIAPQRPGAMPRSKSYFPTSERRVPSSPRPGLNRQALREHDAVDDEQEPMTGWEPPMASQIEAKGRVLSVLQGLDLEADPLIDHNGVKRVIERGKVIALTRSYPYLDLGHEEKPKKRPKMPNTVESSAKLSSFLGTATGARPSSRGTTLAGADRMSKRMNLLSVLDDEEPRPPTPRYEEYEQAPPSPWSQSPAPSPAVRAESNENPFFTEAMVDEDSFNPGPSPHDYTNILPPETIGIDNSWTVLHIPLRHILLSKPAGSFRLSSSALANKTAFRGRADAAGEAGYPERPSSSDSRREDRQSPIAILSILTPLIPYPSNLRYSLEHLAPHLATSFSLCRHYSNLEVEVSGLVRKRPTAAGFGALGQDGRPIANPALYRHLKYAPSEDPSQPSITGSITSPSDASGPVRSAANSPGGSISWDPTSFGLIVERRTTGTSPVPIGAEGYFGDMALANPSAQENAQPRTPSYRPGRTTKPGEYLEKPHAQVVVSGQGAWPDAPGRHTAEDFANTMRAPDEGTHPGSTKKRVAISETSRAEPVSPIGQGIQGHTKLHSYGADFATTFQSLPSGTSVHAPPGRDDKVSMLPPSDRLKGLMLDSLPAHVFVAMPGTGEIMWVNSRYLSYRGQTVADLIVDPWGSVHPDDRDAYLQKWTHSLRTGEQFAYTVRLRRFDAVYRWHQARAIASKDKRGVIVQFIGSYMDIHDQKVAELLATRQEEVEASEAKHRMLANLIPQIIFAATEEDGITFANEQWLSYTGQSFDDSLGLGFIDFVHPEDLAKCRIPSERQQRTSSDAPTPGAKTSSSATPTKPGPAVAHMPQKPLSRNDSERSSSSTLSSTDLDELARKGVIKVATDSTGRLSYTTELRLRSKTGEYRWHLIRCVEINNINFGTGESSYFGSATDINDHKLLEAKLKEAMESKARFLSNMSHEIRTPLIGISGMVSFLQDTVLNEEQRDYTNTIQTSANSLLMIINDILDLSKVDAGMMKLNFEWFHTRSLIEDVNELVSAMAIAKRLELNYVVEQDVPSWVKGDKVRIRQVLLNVVGNAIKFTSHGEIFSLCKVIQRVEGDEPIIELEFSVIDTGRGFTKEESELIFKPFSQIDGSSTRQHGGSGLGLVISRQLVELHGGSMNGTAVPGEGSTFTFTARFGLPTINDNPGIPVTPPVAPLRMASSEDSAASGSTLRPSAIPKLTNTPFVSSPSSDASVISPTMTSSAGSDPSVRSVQTQNTARSSTSSVNVGLVHFSEAAEASGQDPSRMRLEMPIGALTPADTPTPDQLQFTSKVDQFRPPMYSILIICPQKFSREATSKHIEITLPKDVPHQITALATVEEAQNLIVGKDAVTFTHIVLNLPSAEEVMRTIDQVMSSSGGKTSVLVLSDSLQRQAVLKLSSDSDHQKLLAQNLVTFVYKPVKPSRFAAVFDPAKLRDLSIDRNRSHAAAMVETQKQSYIDIEKRIGNKGYKVLLVEDNPVNQKVLVRYLKKVGIVAEIANDGVECTEKVFSHPPGFYTIILVCIQVLPPSQIRS